MIVSASNPSNAFSCDHLSLLCLSLELSKCCSFVIFLLLFQLVDESHLLVYLHQEVLDMAIHVIDVSRDLGLDVLCSIGIPECVLSLVEMLARRAHANNHDGLTIAPK